MVKDNKHFILGLILLVSFFAVLGFIFTPSFGNGNNGLQYADDMFNRLSKGSSYFIPKVAEKNEKFMGKDFEVKFKVETPEIAESAAMLLEHAGAEVQVNDVELHVKGDLGQVLGSALEDADSMYNNDGVKVASKYGFEDGQVILAKYGGEKASDPHAKGEKVLMTGWWQALSKMEKKLAKEKHVAEAKIVGDVNKKAVEPGYNFYDIQAVKVSENALVMTGLLVFYVFYTLWFGFSVFFLFEGIGLSMEKSHSKAEA